MSDRPFTLLKQIGKGSFGRVYKALDKNTQQIVAIKELDLESADDDIEEMQEEIKLLSACESPFITKYHGAFLSGMRLWIVMDYCGIGSIRHLAKMKSGPLDERHISVISSDVLNALVYLHKNNIVHRDIKAANILMTEDGIVKLCDFGVAGQLSFSNLKRNSFVGTPYWMAPEVIRRSGYDYKADIWSYGITVYEMAYGHPPLVELDPMKAILKIPKADPPVIDGTFSRYMKDFVAIMLQKNPNLRPSAEELLKTKFVSKARRNNKELIDLVIRHQQWQENNEKSEVFVPDIDYAENVNTAVNWDFDTVKPVLSDIDTATVDKLNEISEISDIFEGKSEASPAISEKREEREPSIKQEEDKSNFNYDTANYANLDSINTKSEREIDMETVKKESDLPAKLSLKTKDSSEIDLTKDQIQRLSPFVSTLINISSPPLTLDPRMDNPKLLNTFLENLQETLQIIEQLKLAVDAIPVFE